MIRIQNYKYTDYQKEIKQLYESTFPQNERFDFNILKSCDNDSDVHLSAILEDDIFVGMQFTINYPNDITYLMYFAIDEQYRNNGIGSKALQKLVVSKDNVLLCIEKPIDEITQRRKEFYLRNGFFETHTFIEDTGVMYEILTSCRNYIPTSQDLYNRYRCMTTNNSIWIKIEKLFSTSIVLIHD